MRSYSPIGFTNFENLTIIIRRFRINNDYYHPYEQDIYVYDDINHLTKLDYIDKGYFYRDSIVRLKVKNIKDKTYYLIFKYN